MPVLLDIYYDDYIKCVGMVRKVVVDSPYR